jgi:hypothetical protein
MRVNKPTGEKMPAQPRDLTNQRFGRWTVRVYLGGSYWLCVCDCGTEKRVFSGNLHNGKSASCGCLRDEIVSQTSRSHGLSKTPEYKTWAGIKRRCLNPNDKAYPQYGGRGITICQRWSDSFEAFRADMGEKPSPEQQGLSTGQLPVGNKTGSSSKQEQQPGYYFWRNDQSVV